MGKRKPHKAPPLSVRHAEIIRVLRYHYRTNNQQLTDDDAGRDDAELVLQHVAHLPAASRRMRNFLDLWAPWLSEADRAAMLELAHQAPRPDFSADAIAARMGVTFDVRERLALKTIGSTDVLARERRARRAEHQKKLAAARQRKRRRSIGMRPRSEYLATSKSTLKPWEAAGMSRATWYRRTQARAETSVAPQ